MEAIRAAAHNARLNTLLHDDSTPSVPVTDANVAAASGSSHPEDDRVSRKADKKASKKKRRRKRSESDDDDEDEGKGKDGRGVGGERVLRKWEADALHDGANDDGDDDAKKCDPLFLFCDSCVTPT